MNPDVEQSGQGLAGPVAHTPWLMSQEERLRRFFLGRLEYLVQLRDGLADGPKPGDDRLIKWSLYSNYRDCISVGAGDEARALLAD